MIKPRSILFVCMGNICRSPTAHGVFQHKVTQQGLERTICVDSAGTHNYHPNSPPDKRSQEHSAKRGYDLSGLRARQITAVDFDRHDLILVMDWDNLALVQDICPPEHRHKVRRLTEFCLTMDSQVVPDPYYSGAAGFDQVLDLVEDACDGFTSPPDQSNTTQGATIDDFTVEPIDGLAGASTPIVRAGGSSQGTYQSD